MTGLAYHPRQHMAATTSTDGSLRIWAQSPARRRAATAGIKGQPPAAAPAATWRCLSSSAYQGKCSLLRCAAALLNEPTLGVEYATFAMCMPQAGP